MNLGAKGRKSARDFSAKNFITILVQSCMTVYGKEIPLALIYFGCIYRCDIVSAGLGNLVKLASIHNLLYIGYYSSTAV